MPCSSSLPIALLSLAASVAHVSASELVLRNGSIYTIDSRFTKAHAIAITNGTIDYVGSNNGANHFITNDTKVIELDGRTVIPGLVDAHMHTLSGGETLIKCNLNYQYLGLEEILKHIQGCIDSEPDKTDDIWLEVLNMDYPSLVEKSGRALKTQLDQLNTKRPVHILSSDYHTYWANSRALEVSGITSDTPNPSDGVIERLPGSQEPSGILQDGAGNLLKGPNPPTLEDNVESANAALRLLREQGITTFQDASAASSHYEAFGKIQQDGNLTARVFLDYRIDFPASAEEIPSLVKNVTNQLSSVPDNKTPIGPKPFIRSMAIKAFLDGVITYPSITAAVIESYWTPVNGSKDTWAPDPDTLRETYWKPEILKETLEQLFLADVDVQIHADGDLAVRVGLDAADVFHQKHPAHDFKLGIAHDELSHQDDWPRFAELGVNPIVSYQWAQLSSFYIPDTFNSIAEYRHRNLQSWGELEARGSTLVYGSDWPVDPLDEFLALKVAVTRTGDPENPNSPASQGSPYDQPFPGPSISRETAIASITRNSAGFLRADDKIGSLEPSKLADLVVLDKDFFEVPIEECGRVKVLLTMVGGEVLYVADGNDFGVAPKFPNEDHDTTKMARRTVGGFAGGNLSARGRAAVAKLRKRQDCGHGHSH